MADLAGGSGCSAQQPSVDDQAFPDTRRRLDVGEVRALTTRAPCHLGECAQVGIVFDLYRHPESLLHLAFDSKSAPTRQDAGRTRRPSAAIDRSWNSHSGSDHRLAIDMSFTEYLVDHACGRVRAGAGVRADVQVAPPLGEHVMSDVGDRNLNVAVAEIDAHSRERRVAQHQLHGRPAPTNLVLARVHLVDQAGILELRDKGVNRGAGKSGDARDVGLADAPALAQRSQDALSIALPQPAERPLTILRHTRHRESWAPAGVCQELEQIVWAARSRS